MNNQEIYNHMDKIGCLTFSTIHEGYVQSRIAHFYAVDHEGFYFRTMENKPFARQLKSSGNVTICGMYPGTQLLKVDDSGEPTFPAGYTFRLTGDIKEVPADAIYEKAKNNPQFKTALFDMEKYPATISFCIYKGKGEIFDFDFEMDCRDHKLKRTRFSMGGAKFNPSGCIITDDCIQCGNCFEACTFKAVMPGNPYVIDGEKCDECGSCLKACPAGAIKESRTL